MDFGKIKIMVTGASGLVGSDFFKRYKKNCIFAGIDPESDIELDLLSQKQIEKVVADSKVEVVLNFAAYTNVDKAEEQKGDKNKEVYILNAMAPFWLARTCRASGKSFYHISTDYVFSGKKSGSPYNEEDDPQPVNSWYAETKYMGELKVAEGFKGVKDYSIIRISYPFTTFYKPKFDIVRGAIDRLSKNQQYFSIYNQKIKPTAIKEITKALHFLISNRLNGIYHVAGRYTKGFITPYEFILTIAGRCGLDTSLVKKISFSEFSKKRVAPRPQHTWLDTTKIESLGMKFINFEDIVEESVKDLKSI